MFNLTGSEIVVILLLALVVLGPEKLPDAIRRFGRTYAELKRMGNGFQQEFRSAIDEPMREMRDSADLLRKSVDFDAEGVDDRRADDAGRPRAVPVTPPVPQPIEPSDGTLADASGHAPADAPTDASADTPADTPADAAALTGEAPVAADHDRSVDAERDHR